MLSNLLIYRLTLTNACIGAFLVWTFMQGLLQKLFAVETTGIGYSLVILAGLAIIGVFHRAMKVGTAFDRVKGGEWVDTRKFLIKSAYIGQIAVYLMLAGLIGNILGILISVFVVDFTSIDTILTSVSGMYGGLKVAFANSLIGTTLGLFIRINYHFLATATRLLMIDASDLRKKDQTVG